MSEQQVSKGPWILIGTVFLIQALVWFFFIRYAIYNQPESIPLEPTAVEKSE